MSACPKRLELTPRTELRAVLPFPTQLLPYEGETSASIGLRCVPTREVHWLSRMFASPLE